MNDAVIEIDETAELMQGLKICGQGGEYAEDSNAYPAHLLFGGLE